MKIKNFDIWNMKKKDTHLKNQRPFFRVRDIWWAQLGQNIATEVLGKGEDFLRPVIILQVVYGNSCLAIPLSSKGRKGDYYHSFKDAKGHFQCALLTQIRYLDGKRMKYQQSTVGKTDFESIKRSFQNLINK